MVSKIGFSTLIFNSKFKRKNLSNSKIGAMEMSVGTIVTIVLLMSVLVLGIFLIQKIGNVARGAIGLTEQQLYSELKKGYNLNPDRKLIFYPDARKLEIKKGKSDELGLIINNRLEKEETFSYKINFVSGGSCGITEDQALSMVLPKERQGMIVASGQIPSNPLVISFIIPESATLCKNIIYSLNVFKSNNEIYDNADITLEII